MRIALVPCSLLAAFVPPASLVAQTADFSPSDLARHYAHVEAELRASPLPPDPEVAARRMVVLDVLHEYRVRGNFGDDPSGSGERNPLFVDADGRRCAVAFLLDRTGHGRVTEAIAATRNEAWVVELARDPDLQQWLTSHGLTATEAARIQGPGWGGRGPDTFPPPPDNGGPAGQTEPDGDVTPDTSTADGRTASNGANRSAAGAAPAASAIGSAASPTPGTARGGFSLAALGAPEWIQWWTWNRDRFEIPPQPVTEDLSGTGVRIATRAQAVQALKVLATHAQADVRASASQALARLHALDTAAVAHLDENVREVRLSTLATVGCTSDVKDLFALAKSRLPAMQGEDAVVALAACACSDSDAFLGMLEPRLLAAFEATSPDAVAAAALTAASGRKPRVRELARRLVREDGDAWRRGLLAAALALGAEDEDVAALTVALGARSPILRRGAAVALGRSRAELALPALMTAYELEHEQAVRGAILLAIGDHAGKAGLPFLREELTNGPRALRVLAAVGLGLWGRDREDDDETGRIATAMAADHNHDHTGGYLLALGLLGDARASALLQNQLKTGSTSSTRSAAANALGLLRNANAIPHLRIAADADSCPWVRGQCARALGRIGEPAHDALCDLLLHEPNVEVRRAAALALGDTGSPRSAAMLLAVAADAETPPMVLAAAATSLGRLFRLADPHLPALRSTMDPQAVPSLVAWVAYQDL